MDVFRNGNITIAQLPPDGPIIANEQDIVDVIGELWGREVDLLAIPVARLAEDFFRLRTGLAGAVLQKLQTYGFRVAVVGDIARWTDLSTPLADFVAESNRRGQVLFVDGQAELAARL